MSRRTVAVMCVALGAAVGCSDAEAPVQCAPHPDFTIVATVTDSVSGAPAAQGAGGVAVDGAVRDTLVAEGPARMQNRTVRVGTYTVTIRRPGYRDWVRAGVEVRERGDVCRVVAADPLTVRLQPAD
jgi:hypothetical protein